MIKGVASGLYCIFREITVGLVVFIMGISRIKTSTIRVLHTRGDYQGLHHLLC